MTETKMPKECINGIEVRERKFKTDEIGQLYVAPQTSIKLHEHYNQWEILIWLPQKKAYICLIGEKHEIINNTDQEIIIMTIKGSFDYSYLELADVLYDFGFSVYHKSMVVS